MSDNQTLSETRAAVDNASPPNIVVMICDDLGYGDLGCHGNNTIETPNIDAFYDESIRFSRFYGGPMCSPARASLMTGRYHYRTSVLHTSLGHALLHLDEVTLPQALSEAGYRTAHSGKWHLGDNYPLRPHDRGFDQALYHRSGGIGGWGDIPGNSYFDPTLHRDGERKQYEGYCTDIFTDDAIEFIESHHDEPFFLYLATNAAHTPYQIADEYADPYRDQGLAEQVARYYGMVTNIDENIGRILSTLDALDITEDTIVVFTSDHGARQIDEPRYKVGLRGNKGSVYEGGVRVPFFVRWPQMTEGGRDIDQIAHMTDILPTILEAVDESPPTDRIIDGDSLLPLMSGEPNTWPDRRIFIQQTRSDRPELHQNATVITGQYKLVNGIELYDLRSDPGETRDISAKHPDLVTELRELYEAWYEDVQSERDFQPPRIIIGSPHENPTWLTRNDWMGSERNSKKDADVGYWQVDVDRPGEYDFDLRFSDVTDASASFGTLHLRIADAQRSHTVVGGETSFIFTEVSLDPGPTRIEAWIELKEAKSYTEPAEKRGVRSVHVSYRGE